VFGGIGGVSRLMGLFTLDYPLTLGSWGFMFTKLGIGQYPQVPSDHTHDTKLCQNWLLYIISVELLNVLYGLVYVFIYTLDLFICFFSLLKHGVHSSMDN